MTLRPALWFGPGLRRLPRRDRVLRPGLEPWAVELFRRRFFKACFIGEHAPWSHSDAARFTNEIRLATSGVMAQRPVVGPARSRDKASRL